MGRPSLATPDAVETIERALGRGATVGQAAKLAQVSSSTVKNWLRTGVVVRRRLQAVEVVGLGDVDPDRLEEELVEIVVAAARAGDLPSARWLLSQRWRSL